MNRNHWPEYDQGRRSSGREHGEDDVRPYPAGGFGRGNDECRYRDARALPRGWSDAQSADAREDEYSADWPRAPAQDRDAGDFWRGMARGDSALFGASEADYAGGQAGEGRWNRHGYPDEEQRALRGFGAHAPGRERLQPGWQGNTLYGAGDPEHAPSPAHSRTGRKWQQAPWAEGRAGEQRPQARPGSYRRHGPRDYARSDERITEDLNERLADNDMLDASDISVRVVDGVATLSGSVASRWMRHLAEDIADSCSGVKDIRNKITVAASGMRGPFPRGDDDGELPGGGRPA